MMGGASRPAESARLSPDWRRKSFSPLLSALLSKMDGEISQLQVGSRRRSKKRSGRSGAQSGRCQQLPLSLLVLAYCCCILIPVPSNQVPREHLLRPSVAGSPTTKLYLRQQQQQSPLLLVEQQITPLPLLSPLPSNNNNQHPDAPKLIPLSALERYQEGADLRLFCSASASPTGGRIAFEWRKNQLEQLTLSAGSATRSNNNNRVHVSLMDDDSASVLRINHLEADDSGNYTCSARNQHGFDSSTVRVNVNVRLKWIREPPGELQVRAGKSVQLECDASGQPAPLISWTSLKDQQTIHSKVLRIDRVQVNDSGVYECRATSGGQLHSAAYGSQTGGGGGEQLRKLVKLVVNGK